MRCKEISTLLIGYQENSLGPEDRGMVEKHLRECDRCRRELEGIEKLYHLLAEDRIPPPEQSFWAGFLPEVRTRIDGKQKARGAFVFKPRLAVGILAVLTVALVGFFMFTLDKKNLVDRQLEQIVEITLSQPELSSTTEELAEALFAESEASLDVFLSNGEGQELDLIEGILEEDYLSQGSLNSILNDLDAEELKKLEEGMKALRVGDIL